MQEPTKDDSRTAGCSKSIGRLRQGLAIALFLGITSLTSTAANAQTDSSAAPAAAATPADKPAERTAADATAAEVLTGQKLFTGEQRLRNGGAPCMSCHTANHPALKFGGGVLAADVTESYGRMGDAIKVLIAEAPFPPMAMAYKDHPVTGEEAYELVAFLKVAGEAKGGQDAGSSRTFLGVGGVVGLIVVLGGLNLLWSQRKKLSTKHAILERQTRSV